MVPTAYRAVTPSALTPRTTSTGTHIIFLSALSMRNPAASKNDEQDRAAIHQIREMPVAPLEGMQDDAAFAFLGNCHNYNPSARP